MTDTNVTNELTVQILRSLQEGQSRIEHRLDTLQGSVDAMRHVLIGALGDNEALSTRVATNEADIARIKRRLELSD